VTAYQGFLLGVLIVWPLVIVGILFLMSKLEDYVKKMDAQTPEEAGLEPVEGRPQDPEVRIVFGDRVVGGSDRHATHGSGGPPGAAP
jgi:hypothetical protein